MPAAGRHRSDGREIGTSWLVFVEARIPARVRVLDLCHVVAVIGDRMGWAASGVTRVPVIHVTSQAKVIPSPRRHLRAARSETFGSTEAPCDAVTVRRNVDLVQQVAGLDEREPSSDRAPDDRLGNAGSVSSSRAPRIFCHSVFCWCFRTAAAGWRDGTALVDPTVIERDLTAERADVDELRPVRGEVKRVRPPIRSVRA